VTPARLKKISKTIEEAAGAYCKRVWWVERLELMQEGWEEVISALKRWESKHQRELPEAWLGGFVYKVATRRMSAFCWANSSPVTGGGRGGSRAKVGAFKAITGDGALEALEQVEAAPESRPDARVLDAEATAGIEAAREELFWRVAELYGEFLERMGRQAQGMLFEAVLQVLVDGAESTAAASATGARLGKLYAETVAVKKLIVADATAAEILEEIKEWRTQM
jgi:hypothetical protein